MLIQFTKSLMLIAIACTTTFVVSATATAGTADTLKKATAGMIEDFKGSKLNDRTQSGLNKIIENGIAALRDRKLNDLADRFEREWTQSFSTYFLQWQLLDLGDHRPLFQWLADFHASLEKNLGKDVCSALDLDDLRILNFGIPVVFNPNGDATNNDRWDKVEYRKHFIPLTSIVLFWGLKSVCDANFTGVTKRFCHTVLRIPRAGYEKWVAPVISDYVYDLSHRSMMLQSSLTAAVPEKISNGELMAPLEVLWPLTEQ